MIWIVRSIWLIIHHDATTESPAPIADPTVADSIDPPPPEAGLLPKKITRQDILLKLQTLNYKQ
jgi:hypothetical protein